jgi:ribosomal protein S18 acetylase RimI-like enzyme
MIHYVPEIEGTPVVGFLARAWVDLLDNNLWDSTLILLTRELQCVYATQEHPKDPLSGFTAQPSIVGAISFYYDEDDKFVSINLAYVDPDLRRMGIMAAMFAEVQRHAKEQGAQYIANVCYPQNKAIQDFCRSVGGYEYSHEYRINVPQ